MLSIGKLGQGQADYYLEAVAQGIEDYYTGAGEAPGRWTGSASRELGIGGSVEDDALHAALSGANPRTGDPLAERYGGNRVPGFDLTFSAPKSVSLLYGLAEERISAEVTGAHETAVDRALDYVERHAAMTRRGSGGAETIRGNGFVAAAFRHRSSRAGDPQLHTHVLVANMTKGTDGRWTALDGRRIYAHAKTAGYLYEAQLRAELSRRLGVEWGPIRNGIAELDGIPQPVLRAFSRRRAEIEQAMAERGERSARAAQVAALDTRRAKDYGVSPESLRERWRDQAERLGLGRDELGAVIGRSRALGSDVDRVADELASPQGLTAQRSSFTRRDAIRAFCERLPEGVDVATAERLADEFLASDRAVALVTDVRGLTGGDVIRRADGRVVAASTDERRYSTPELLAVERRLIEGALARQGEGTAVASESSVDAALARRPTLGDDQAVMVRRLTQDGGGVQVVTGKAGTGKTFALDAAREAWEAEGYRVIGAAVARRAARELEDGAGIESTSLAALLKDLRMGGEYGLPERSVVVLDEAGMAGTRQLAELLDHAQAPTAKVVLVGDAHQLPEIDAGGAFRALLVRTDPIVLTANRRQRADWEREALDDLREGHAEQAIASYRRHGRVALADCAEDVRARLVADWWQAAQDGDAAMIALRRADVADLNDRARGLMRASGRLGPDELWVAGRGFALGDHVVTLKNDGRVGAVNGVRGVVTAIDREASELAVRTHDGRELILPRSYLEAQTERGGATLDHGYAITGHKAQGMTTERAFVLGSDNLYREWGYVALSRGREENRLYVVAPQGRERDEYAPREPTQDPLDAVIGSLTRSEAQTAAIDVAERELIRDAPTRDLVAERSRLAGELSRGEADERRLERLVKERQHVERWAEDAAARASEFERTGGRRSKQLAGHERARAALARERVEGLAERQSELEARVAAARPQALERRGRHAAIRDELEFRARETGRVAAIERPGYLAAELGDYPERPSERRTWERAAARIESYRHEFDVSDCQRALGSEPRELPQRSERRAVQREIDQALRSLDHARSRHKDLGRGLG